jgi:hypothetical protein
LRQLVKIRVEHPVPFLCLLVASLRCSEFSRVAYLVTPPKNKKNNRVVARFYKRATRDAGLAIRDN